MPYNPDFTDFAGRMIESIMPNWSGSEEMDLYDGWRRLFEAGLLQENLDAATADDIVSLLAEKTWSRSELEKEHALIRRVFGPESMSQIEQEAKRFQVRQKSILLVWMIQSAKRDCRQAAREVYSLLNFSIAHSLLLRGLIASVIVPDHVRSLFLQTDAEALTAQELDQARRREAIENPPPDPFATLRPMVVEELRQLFEHQRRLHPGEHFYAYALRMEHETGFLLTALSQTEEVLQQRHRKWHCDSSYSGTFRYCPEEWDFDPGPLPGEHDFWHRLPDELERLYNEILARDFLAPRSIIVDFLMSCLQELDREAFFGVGEAREAVTLLVNITDDDFWWKESVRLLNSASVYKRFQTACIRDDNRSNA